ncbi:MAG: hypothetical protein Q7S92_01560 [Candidatus Diapherotrites archaeon]|nr:hypothetical protein [Candidatus Diapherotrites archaeon]
MIRPPKKLRSRVRQIFDLKGEKKKSRLDKKFPTNPLAAQHRLDQYVLGKISSSVLRTLIKKYNLEHLTGRYNKPERGQAYRLVAKSYSSQALL